MFFGKLKKEREVSPPIMLSDYMNNLLKELYRDSPLSPPQSPVKSGASHQPVIIPLEPLSQYQLQIQQLMNSLKTVGQCQPQVLQHQPVEKPAEPVEQVVEQVKPSPPQVQRYVPVKFPLETVGKALEKVQPSALQVLQHQPVQKPLEPVAQVVEQVKPSPPQQQKMKSKRRCKFFGTAKGCLKKDCKFRHIQNIQQPYQPFHNNTQQYQQQPKPFGYKMPIKRHNNTFHMEPYY